MLESLLRGTYFNAQQIATFHAECYIYFMRSKSVILSWLYSGAMHTDKNPLTKHGMTCINNLNYN